ncbi:hypothetical protein [Sphingomicrobium clamense]|uniref:Uncharacterized protein n=1 Tax=Sphingomicrobium clamense TaxID=2851013 RepID=A0ABS6V3N8_9SPHN|nr:hypothetical protein [Sphingomicrobium sp. B8]MBW0144171.1 hypothetical protein [Sphingomicrobium sp. B8]
MRTVIVLLILVVAVLIVAVGSGLVDIRQTQPAELPEVSVTDEGVEATGGRQPTFDVETGSVAVGSETRAVTVPKLEVEPATETAEGESQVEEQPATP